MPEVSGRLPDLDGARSGPASISPPTRPSRACRRELTARDYVYSILRTADPANRSELWTWIAQLQDAAAWPRSASVTSTPRPRSTTTTSPRACARSTATRCSSARTSPARASSACWPRSDLLGAVAREVVEFYGDKIGEHPVGTGPFRLKTWRRSSQIVLERNPDYRELLYDAEPAADDAEGQAILARLQGPAPADGRRVEVVDHRGGPAALAVLPERRDRRAGIQVRLGAGQLRRRRPCPTARSRPTWPSAASSGTALRSTPTSRSPTSTWKTRWSAATRPSKVALRRAIALAHRHRPRDPHRPPRPGDPGAVRSWCRTPPATTRTSRARSATTTRRAPRPCSTCTAMSTATATAGATSPTARRW